MTQERAACRWHIRAGENESKDIPAFFRRHSITDGLARILMRRGLDTEDKLSHFLYDDLSDLSDPFLMKGMKEGVTRLLSAIDHGEKIVVYGDYDVDGITSTSILVRCLKGMGADVGYYIPRRETEGYGLNEKALISLRKEGYTLLITVDCGISSAELIARKPEGLDIIVTDHHTPPEQLPSCIAVINPHQKDCPYPYKELAGCGVAFMVARALHLARDGADFTDNVELAALGTIADVVSLIGENRILVREGMKRFLTTSIKGLSSLLIASGIVHEDTKAITHADQVSFGLAPRLNAAGRIAHAREGVQLMTTESSEEAERLASQLCDTNVTRQQIERNIFEEAQKRIAELQIEKDMALVVDGQDWHPGVIGIVASRLVERTGRPVIVVTVDEHGECKGSGRSVPGFNLHACIGSCADLLIRYGGHAMAAGLSVREENLPELRRRLNEWAARECPVLHTAPLECDLPIHLDRVTVDSVRRIDALAPFGAENPTPVFLLQSAVVDGVYPVSEGRHSRLRLRQGNASVYAVWFGMPPEQLPYTMGDVVDAALNLSVYESARGAQLSGRILDLHPAGLGTKLAEQAALVAALRRGTPLTAEQKTLITPDRSHIITVYRELQARRWHAEDLQPLCAKLGEENTGKTLVAVTALEQVGLIATVEKGGAKYLELVPAQGKKNLADAPILKCLEGM